MRITKPLEDARHDELLSRTRFEGRKKTDTRSTQYYNILQTIRNKQNNADKFYPISYTFGE